MKNIVIGSGPAGRLGSLELGKLGKEVTLIEKNHIAGTCLNEGCMVICALTDITKFIESNNRFNSYGFIKSQLDISYEKIVEKINKEDQRKIATALIFLMCLSIGLTVLNLSTNIRVMVKDIIVQTLLN